MNIIYTSCICNVVVTCFITALVMKKLSKMLINIAEQSVAVIQERSKIIIKNLNTGAL